MFKKGINSYLNLDEANELIDGIDTTGKWRELTDGERKHYAPRLYVNREVGHRVHHQGRAYTEHHAD